MYARDQAAIERWCKNPDKFLDVGTMVLLTIRMQWVGVGNQLAKVRAGDYKPLWGFKLDGYKYLRANRKRLYQHVRDARAGRIWIDDLMREFLKVPGLGLAKAGFLTQILTGQAGCLDMHNVARFDLDERVWTVRNLADPADQMREIDDKIALYLDLCELCGGSETLWDEWCHYVAERVSTFDGADDVSRRHYTYLTGRP